MKYPFEVSYAELKENTDVFVDAVFASLESEFLIMPKGAGFVEYAVFEQGYEILKKSTGGFRTFETESILKAARDVPMVRVEV